MTSSDLVIVTGGGRGFGRALGECALGRGLSIVALTRSRVTPSPPFPTLHADCANAAELGPLMPQLRSHIADAAKVHLINNAGYYLKRPFNEHTPDDFLTTLRSNVQAAVNVVAAIADHRPLDTIVNVVSTSALGYNVPRTSLARKTAYAASKAAFAHLTEELANATKDGRCISVYPRNINTWSEAPEADSMSRIEFAEWLLDLVLCNRSFVATDSVILPAR